VGAACRGGLFIELIVKQWLRACIERETETGTERGTALDTAGDDGTAAYCSVRLSCQLSGLVCTLNRLVRALLQLPTDHVDNHLLISSPV